MPGWTSRYVGFQKIYGLGEGQLGFVKNILNLAGVANILVFVKLYFPDWSDLFLVMAPVAVVAYISIGFGLGKALDEKFHFVHTNRRWDNVRDPAIKEILERLRRIEAKGG